MNTSDIYLVFRDTNGEHILWSPHDLVENGTPIDAEDGSDLPYIGWQFAKEENVRGCSCGMADYGAPGHDGHEESGHPMPPTHKVWLEPSPNHEVAVVVTQESLDYDKFAECAECGDDDAIHPENGHKFVAKSDDDLANDEQMLNAAAVGHASLIERNVVVTRISDDVTKTFSAQDCREWWA